MHRELSVLLVEDEGSVCRQIQSYIDTLDDIVLVGMTGDEDEALSMARYSLPDAIILDLELHFGKGNGLSFLQRLNGTWGIQKKPFILVTTNNASTVTYDAVRRQGADFIMHKHQQNYSPETPVEFLRMMKDTIHIENTCTESTAEHPTQSESPEIKNKRMIKRICSELDKVGISPKAVGYKYLTDAILLTAVTPQRNICVHIAKLYGKTDSSVERAMQNAINRAWRLSEIDQLTQNYTARINSDRGVPTLNEFIFYYANKLNNEF